MLYEVITCEGRCIIPARFKYLTNIVQCAALAGFIPDFPLNFQTLLNVITSYSIHYTKLYDNQAGLSCNFLFRIFFSN